MISIKSFSSCFLFILFINWIVDVNRYRSFRIHSFESIFPDYLMQPLRPVSKYQNNYLIASSNSLIPPVASITSLIIFSSQKGRQSYYFNPTLYKVVSISIIYNSHALNLCPSKYNKHKLYWIDNLDI